MSANNNDSVFTATPSHNFASQKDANFLKNLNNFENPFLKSGKMSRSPTRARANSFSTGSTKQQQNTGHRSNQEQFSEKMDTSNKTEEIVIIKNLESQLKAAQNEIKELRELLTALQYKKENGIPTTWEEEEEIVAQETAWMLPKSKKNKKRKAVGSPEKTDSDPQTTTKNNTKTMHKSHKPPPIILSNVVDYNQINQNLKTKNIKFQTKLLNNNQLKVNVDSESEYRDVTSIINTNKIEWHTYENKQTRPIRVMARHLHPTCSPEMIMDDLISRNFEILEATNKIKKIKEDKIEKRIPLPLFMLTFKNTQNIKDIYEIKHICGMQVKIEAIRTSKLIPQCKKCQRYGHTHKYCQRSDVCVKCAGNHSTSVCNKPRDSKPKCSNCGEAHPASYRGCSIAKELQKRRNNIIQSRNKPKEQEQTEQTESTQQKIFTTRNVSSDILYAQATANNNNSQTDLPQQEDASIKQMIHEMKTMISQISVRLDRLEARSTGTIPRSLSNDPTRY